MTIVDLLCCGAISLCLLVVIFLEGIQVGRRREREDVAKASRVQPAPAPAPRAPRPARRVRSLENSHARPLYTDRPLPS